MPTAMPKRRHIRDDDDDIQKMEWLRLVTNDPSLGRGQVEILKTIIPKLLVGRIEFGKAFVRAFFEAKNKGSSHNLVDGLLHNYRSHDLIQRGKSNQMLQFTSSGMPVMNVNGFVLGKSTTNTNLRISLKGQSEGSPVDSY